MSSRGRGQVKRSGNLWWLTPCALTGLIAAALFASGCAVSRLSNPFKSGDEDTSASAVNENRLLETAKADTGTDMPTGAGAEHGLVQDVEPEQALQVRMPERAFAQYATAVDEEFGFGVHRGFSCS